MRPSPGCRTPNQAGIGKIAQLVILTLCLSPEILAQCVQCDRDRDVMPGHGPASAITGDPNDLPPQN